jgi:hypothetical protein
VLHSHLGWYAVVGSGRQTDWRGGMAILIATRTVAVAALWTGSERQGQLGWSFSGFVEVELVVAVVWAGWFARTARSAGSGQLENAGLSAPPGELVTGEDHDDVSTGTESGGAGQLCHR